MDYSWLKKLNIDDISKAVLLFTVFMMFSVFSYQTLFVLYDDYQVEQGNALVLGRDSVAPIAAPTDIEIEDSETLHQFILDGEVIGEEKENFKLDWPVYDGVGIISQCFSEDGHEGVDIADYQYPDIVSAAPGLVTHTGCFEWDECPPEGSFVGGTGLARSVMIRHLNGFVTVYSHLHEIYVEEGEYIDVGEVIAKMGQTGLVRPVGEGQRFGVHLHFGLMKEEDSWEMTDPMEYMEGECRLEIVY